MQSGVLLFTIMKRVKALDFSTDFQSRGFRKIIPRGRQIDFPEFKSKYFSICNVRQTSFQV